jgi:hypothetical protein
VNGVASCGELGIAKAGAVGIAIADVGGSVQGGERSILILRGTDEWFVARVGYDGIKADTLYRLHDEQFVEVLEDDEG